MFPKAILFDLDDTLISPHLHRTIFWKDAIEQVWIEQRALIPVPSDIGKLVEHIDVAAKLFWSDPQRHKTGRLNLKKARFDILQNGIRSDPRFDEPLKWSIADRCGALMSERTTLFPDAISTLKKLLEKNIKLALVTNGTSIAQRAKINKFHLEQYFSHIQIEGEAGIGKPEPGAYVKAMAALKVDASDTWMVGDNIEWEVVAPQKLGIFSVWRDPKGNGTLPPGTKARPDMIIASLSELIQ
ncbi:MAG: phosphoglycolate phosphatase [Rhodospirillaceae bacterium]|nr:phosphoglycolate phosphatase [Rhodospirillaceae bacterium]|tara:strand:+ start:1560 stop:2285 length:726 start_codon:yes stop_codon:yes gene_type:complete